MQCDSRAGLRRICGVFEAVAGGAEHLVGGDAEVVDLDLGVAAGHRTVDRVESRAMVLIAGSGRSTMNRQAPSSDFAMTMPTWAPSAPVMNFLRPLMTQ